MHSAMRKSLVTFGSVESQWSDKGRSQIVRREGLSRGSGSDLLFKSYENREDASWAGIWNSAEKHSFEEVILKHSNE